MDSLIELLSKVSLPVVVVAIAALASLLTTLFSSSDTPKKKEKAKDGMFALLEAAIKENRNLDFELISHFKSSIEREHQVEFPMLHLLEDFLVRINQTENDIPKDRIEDVNSKIRELISIDTQTTPYENLPEEERRLIRGLSDSIEHDDKDGIRFNLDELSSVLVVRHKTYSRANKLNKWSVPLAIAGCVFTIIFGLTGIVGGTKPSDLEPIVKKAVIECIKDQAKITPNKANAADTKSRAAD